METFVLVLFLVFTNGQTETVKSKDVYFLEGCTELGDKVVQELVDDFPGISIKGGCFPSGQVGT